MARSRPPKERSHPQTWKWRRQQSRARPGARRATWSKAQVMRGITSQKSVGLRGTRADEMYEGIYGARCLRLASTVLWIPPSYLQSWCTEWADLSLDGGPAQEPRPGSHSCNADRTCTPPNFRRREAGSKGRTGRVFGAFWEAAKYFYAFLLWYLGIFR